MALYEPKPDIEDIYIQQDSSTKANVPIFIPYVSDITIFTFVVDIVLCLTTCAACYRKGYTWDTMSNSLLCITCASMGMYVQMEFETSVEAHWILCAFTSTLLMVTCATAMIIILSICAYQCRNRPIYYCLYLVNRGMLFMVALLWWADFEGIYDWEIKYIKYSSSICIDIAAWLLTFMILCVVVDVLGGINYWSSKYDAIIYICIVWYMSKDPMKTISPGDPHIYALMAFSYMFSKKVMEYDLLYITVEE
ncbi:membrane protein EE35 [Proboscivirus elephantidbeta5]|uniref:Membrane protein EE35 n=1 Tax=Elephant endotheliotropic herpesvirus 5 TaxID=768738 RepID=A0A075CZJ8_9BETA|nr:membrane protein EE35 [Elephant endotheliotropic herpesvirus 5]AHC02798.1 membrane protein EE35 [Elephant endotheliotropic herpesvirus 5]